MTRRLILIRHAKSSWAEPDQDDSERCLNPRGRRAAAAIGRWLSDHGFRPDQVLCSSALRTRETAELLGFDAPVEHLDQLYLASAEVMLDVLRGASGTCVAMIGHNPGIGDFAARLLTRPPRGGGFGDYPTGATLVADFPVTDWGRARMHSAGAVEFVVPRDLNGG